MCTYHFPKRVSQEDTLFILISSRFEAVKLMIFILYIIVNKDVSVVKLSPPLPKGGVAGPPDHSRAETDFRPGWLVEKLQGKH